MSSSPVPVAKFRIGRIVTTPEVLDTVPPAEIRTAITRHQAGDWGDIPEDDKRINERSLVDGSQIVSAYHSAKKRKFLLVTEADRRTTTVLLPGQY